MEISYNFFPKKLKFHNKASDELLDDDFTFPVKRSSWRNHRFLKIFNSGFWLNPMIIISLRSPTNLSMTTLPFPSNCRYDDGIAKPLLLFNAHYIVDFVFSKKSNLPVQEQGTFFFYFRKKATRTGTGCFLSFPKLANHLKMSAKVNSFLPKRLIQSI